MRQRGGNGAEHCRPGVRQNFRVRLGPLRTNYTVVTSNIGPQIQVGRPLGDIAQPKAAGKVIWPTSGGHIVEWTGRSLGRSAWGKFNNVTVRIIIIIFIYPQTKRCANLNIQTLTEIITTNNNNNADEMLTQPPTRISDYSNCVYKRRFQIYWTQSAKLAKIYCK